MGVLVIEGSWVSCEPGGPAESGVLPRLPPPSLGDWQLSPEGFLEAEWGAGTLQSPSWEGTAGGHAEAAWAVLGGAGCSTLQAPPPGGCGCGEAGVKAPLTLSVRALRGDS